MAEKAETATVVRWFHLQYPQFEIIGIPNEQKLASKSKNRFAMLAQAKKEGLVPGVSDLFIAVPVGLYHGLWLEMKDRYKTIDDVSPYQLEFIEKMKRVGYAATWKAGADKAIKLITEYMNGSLLEAY